MNKLKKYRTDFLFPKSSFLIGMGSILNINGSYYNFKTSKTATEADFKAVESDWGVTGQDISDSIEVLKKTILSK